MKIAISILSLLNDGYMFADGIFVILFGKYIGPAKPGPWAAIIQRLDLDVFQLGPIKRGLPTLVRSSLFLTLWFLPFGTLVSICVLVLLIVSEFGR